VTVRDTAEYAAIRAYYGERMARRSRVPLMQHIDEGLAILDAIEASTLAQRAFCVHPLVQDNITAAATIADVEVRTLAVEYARVANTALSTRVLASAAEIELSPLEDVNAMLVADKVQNRKDFIAHHRDTHPRSAELDRYFRLWLERLGISETRYVELTAIL
jgi:hypothetical protein